MQQLGFLFLSRETKLHFLTYGNKTKTSQPAPTAEAMCVLKKNDCGRDV